MIKFLEIIVLITNAALPVSAAAKNPNNVVIINPHRGIRPSSWICRVDYADQQCEGKSYLVLHGMT